MKKNLPVSQRERLLPANSVIFSMTDKKGRITYINQDFIDAAGFSEQELLGQPHNIVRHPDMPPAAFADLWQTIADKGVRAFVRGKQVYVPEFHLWFLIFVLGRFAPKRLINAICELMVK